MMLGILTLKLYYNSLSFKFWYDSWWLQSTAETFSSGSISCMYQSLLYTNWCPI